MNSKEFVKALKNICEEKSISEDVIFEGMTTALQKAYTKETGLPNIRIEINKDTGEIPMHIRNAPKEGMEKMGYGVGYKYPHDYPNHMVEQQYLPDKMLGTKYYIKDENIE